MNNKIIDDLGESTLQQHTETVSVTLQLDIDVINWFIKQGDENTHINKTLRSYMESKTIQQIKWTDIKKIKQLFITNAN